MPRMIVVGLANTDRDRNYTPTSESGNELFFPTAGEADEFLRFLELELVPLLEGRYRTTQGRAIVGWSFSGLFSVYAALEKPDLFNASVTQSELGQMHRALGDREKARAYFQGALQAELLKPIPNEVNVRGYSQDIADTSNPP